MKDFLGHTINVGDKCAFIRDRYRSLQDGYVTRITPERVRIEYQDDYGVAAVTYRHGSDVVITQATVYK